MQITAPLALILGLIGWVRDERKTPAVIAAVIGAFICVPALLSLLVLGASCF
ncbi:MAG TPA: hypothetical protein PL151_09130 [Phycisphaerae bacterium]|nr:hypothetical protein [Phycisphaerae bacterium]HOJ73642.1 hypothetical protein [Phycisphaerae bacterium]HOM50289.1 hypothetical protein [Phycisphaerae bacterium]HON67674.1 hypothetical protein [Phycisphaerae bacterium]HOQ84869.1 hypothetical protein [Phycisphaerae bacterium]